MIKKIISKPVLHETIEAKPKLTISCSSSCSKQNTLIGLLAFQGAETTNYLLYGTIQHYLVS